ncbi:LCP family protein [Nocardioides perillae]|uniref:LCP family protein required for cell wall assembly n=1 Tax=Nocardioides perillae TaxID=1119534 RepID=A0A7Y9UKB2_9ACTN|nr:LCP family protein [Nocardioides perillae]NYG55183.1 LCP family protein required for cell wall assembly [Nocardioides perillae]
MPPVLTPGHPGHPGPEERAARVRFRRAMTLMVMTLVLPGSAQLVAGNRRVGRLVLRAWLLLLAAGLLAVVVVALWHGVAFRLAVSATALTLLRWVLVLVAVGWAALFFDAWRLGNPLSLQQRQRLAVVGVNGFLSLGVAGTLLFGSHLVAVQHELVDTLFVDGETSEAAAGRYNVLLLGGDAGAGRWGLRPDSLTVASIDAETGRTVLVGLPRNMASFPFREGSVMAEQFPDGFDCEGCYLNSVSTWAQDHRELFDRPGRAGVDATVMAVEGITGLDVSYYAMVNLAGFKDLVDAVGGVELTVRDRIPVGGLGSDVTGYVEPGRQVLNGHDTLWFARAREGSDDYSRMARQKCVMNALLHQVSPQTALVNFQEIAQAGSAMVSTDLPASEVGRFVQLALRARTQPVSTVSLVPPAVDTADPDVEQVQAMVRRAIDRAEGEAAPPKRRRKAPTTVTGGSLGSRDEGYAANDADDLASAC